MIVETTDLATVQENNGTCGMGTGDPSWGMYVQKAIGDWGTPVQMHNAGRKYITYYEAFGEATCFLLELGAPTAEGDSSFYRFFWSWNMLDTNGGAFRWAGPQNYFDAEDFCGPYTRLHPLYGAGGRAMTYPDGTPATGYFDNDLTDPRKSRVLDAASSKDILGAINYSLGYQDDVAGNPLREGGLLPVIVDGQTHLAGYASFSKDAACPMWVDQQRSSVLYSVARGQIDGIWSDNFSPWNSFGYTAVKVAFGDWSVARFREYLSTHFTAAELTAMGVSNVTTFDVRTALRSKLTALGGTDTNLDDAKWNDASWLNDSLWRAYKIYKRQVGTEALTNYYNASKEAAAQMGVSEFAVMGNDIPVFSLGYCRGALDVVSTELTPGWHMGTSSRGFMMPPVGRFAPAYKVGREHATSRLLNVWMYLDAAYKENPGAVNTIYYEMLANQTLPMLHPGNVGSVTQSATINGGLTSFVKNSRATFGGRDSLADVGIYYSTSSILAYMTPAGFLDMDNQPHTGAYNGWGTALGNLHYQYRPIPEWKLTAEALAKLRVLVIPNAEVLDSTDVTNLITPWVQAGGLLIVTGNSGARKGESGNFDPYANFSLSALTGVTTFSGAPATQLTTVGSGKVYYIKNNIGLAYFNASTATDRANLISGFSTAMNQVLGTDQTLFYPVTPIPDTVGINLYEDPAAQRFFIDVNNYDVNLTTDIVTATPATTFTVKAPAWLASASLANIDVQVLSPTTPAPTVTITKSGTDRIQVTLGAVTNYASVVVTALTTFTWNGGGGTPADSSGTWDATSGNWWTTAGGVWTDLNNAVFGIGTGTDTPYTVTLGSGFNPTVGNLTFANQSYTLTGGTINLGATSVIQVDAGRSATIASVLAGGSSALTKTGSGTLILRANNTYGGATIVNGGTLKVQSTDDLTLVNAGFESPAYGAGGWNYIFSGSDGVLGGWTSTNGSRAGVGHNGSPWVTTAPEGVQAGYVQNIETQGDLNQIITVATGGCYTLAFSAAGRPGQFSSNLAVQIDDTTIAGWDASVIVPGTFNNYSTPLTLSAGTHKLTFKNTSTGGDNATAIDKVTIAGSGAFALPTTTAVNLTVAGATLDLSGAPFVIGSLAGVAGSSVILASPLTAGGDNSSTSFAGAISGSGSFTKTGAGTMMTLSGINTFTGATTVNAGTLNLTGSLHASSAVTLNSSATLTGTGTVNGPLAIASGGSVAPGTGVGTMTAGTTSINGTYICELNGTTADLLNVAGDLTVNPGATLAFSTLGAPTLQSYIVASCSGTLTGTFANVTGTPPGYGVIYDANLKQIRVERTGYGSWISLQDLTGAAAAFDADPDLDGVANGLEFALGGEPNPANQSSNSAGLQPTLSDSAGNFVFSFYRKDVSEPNVVLTCQWSTNLIFLSPFCDIPVGANSSVTDGVTVSITEDVPDALTDTINITVPAAKAAGGKIFLRLKASMK